MAQEVGTAHLIAQREFSHKPREKSVKLAVGKEYSVARIDPLEDPQSGDILCYIAYLNPQGYIAISSDTNITPVIAYSYRSDFIMEDSPQNIFLHMITWDMQNRLAAIPLTSEKIKQRNNEMWDSYLDENSSFLNKIGKLFTWGYWLDTHWGQGGIYQAKCPNDPGGGRSVSGCVATAMAQIVNYWEFPHSLSFSSPVDDYVSTYTTPNIAIDGDAAVYDFPSFPTLSASLSSINYNGNGPNPSDETIGNLMFACGVSVHMYYSSSKSGASTSNVAGALLNKFGYHSAEVKWGTAADFYTVLSNNMKSARPAELAISTSDGSKGHAIVCDGYKDGDDTYHLNYGWYGTNDGWYSLPGGMPSGYSIVKYAVVNIVAPMAVENLALLVRQASNDLNIYFWNVPDAGDWTRWDALARNPSPLARDFWQIPVGNDGIGLTSIDFAGLSRDEITLLVRQGANDLNLYFWNSPFPGDYTRWDARARNPSPLARDFWQIPVGNDGIGLTKIDISSPPDGSDDIALLVRQGAGDLNIYFWNSPRAGDWTRWDALARNPSPLARDFWQIPVGNDGIGLTSIDITEPVDGQDEIALLVRQGANDLNVYFWNSPVAGDWTRWDALARNPSPLARDFWQIPIGNDGIGLTSIDIDGNGKDEIGLLVRQGANDLNIYFWNAPVPGDWTRWDARARNPSPLARDFWQIPVGNDGIGLTGLGME